MEKILTKFKTTTKVVGGLLCLALFLLNLATTTANTSGPLSFGSLKAYADSGAGGSEEETSNLYTIKVISYEDQSTRYTATQVCTKLRTCYSFDCIPDGTEECPQIAVPCSSWGPENCVNR